MTKIFKNVKIGKNSVLEQGVVIGLTPHNHKDGELETLIGENSYIRRNTIIYAGVVIGDNFQTGPNVLIRENNTIGDNVVIWHGTTLNPANIVGDNSRIHVGCFLEMVTLGEEVFLGPNVTFTDDPHPMIPINYRECWGGAVVKKGAVIGGGSIILPRVIIGKYAVVGAGSVVVENIEDYKVAVGNPAKEIKEVGDIRCNRSGQIHYPYRKKYEKHSIG